MKKQILTLMVSAAVFAMNPAFGMEEHDKRNQLILNPKLETLE